MIIMSDQASNSSSEAIKTDKLPIKLEETPAYKFILEKKSREFLRETLPKIQENNNCGPYKAAFILARTLGYKQNLLHDKEVAKQLGNLLKELKLNFPSKTLLSSYLAIEKGTVFSFRHSDQRDQLVIDIPGLTGVLKTSRFAKGVKMRMEGGSHAYYFNRDSKKTIKLNQKKINHFMDQKILETKEKDWYGFDKITLMYHIPISDIGHFLQSVLPQVEIHCQYGEATLNTSNKEIREGKFKLKIKKVKAPAIRMQYISKNGQNLIFARFNTTCEKFLEKVTIIHGFISKIIEEIVSLAHETHRLVQVEIEEGSSKYKFIFPFTLYVKPLYYSDYYASKFSNVNNLFFSFPTDIGPHGAISSRVILEDKSDDKIGNLEFLFEHNRKYIHEWSISLLRDCIEKTQMISAERLRQFLGTATNPEIETLISQLERVYEQYRNEVEYYEKIEQKRQALMLKRFSYAISAILLAFTIIQGFQAILWLFEFLG